MSEILDSGKRTEFETGAVRDLQEHKGRCDLMPLDVVNLLLTTKGESLLCHPLYYIERYKVERETVLLLKAAKRFIELAFDNDEVEALLEVSIHFEEGARKYGENNWQKGLPEWSYLSSAVRHYLKWHRGDEDERHDRAFLWNIICLVWTVEQEGNEEEG